MRLPRPLAASALIPIIVLIVSCSDEKPESEGLAKLAEVSSATLNSIELNRGLLTAADTEPDAEAEFEQAETAMRFSIETLTDLTLEERWNSLRDDLMRAVVTEREVWLHMVLFARTEQEVHRSLATDLVFQSDEQLAKAVFELRTALNSEGLSDSGLGVPSPAQAVAVVVPTSTPVPATATPTPILSAVVPTVPPAPLASITPIPSPTAASTVTSTPSPPEPTVTPTSTRTVEPTSSPESAPTPEPSPTSAPTFEPSPTSLPPTPLPSPTPIPTSTVLPTTTPTPTAAPTATVTATPVPVEAPGSLVVIRYPDLKGRPAFIAHWVAEVEPDTLAYVEYPFVANDEIEVSLYGNTLPYAYFESPDGEKLIEKSDLDRVWNTEVIVESDGIYRFYFSNISEGEPKTMHLLLTYHESAPGSIVPPN